MSTGAGYFLLGLFLDAVGLIMLHFKVPYIITIPIDIISIALMIIGIVKINKYDKAREAGRKALEEKKKNKNK